MAAVRILHEIKISPSLPSQPPQPLSILDLIWLQNLPVERIHFYNFPHPISHFIDHNLPILTKSLSLTLRHFYLFAGSIRSCPNSADRFEIAYEEGDSVTVTVAEFTGNDFRSMSGHHPRNLEEIRLLVPRPTKPSAVGQFSPITIQITLFNDQGVSIGFALNHAVCDGQGMKCFLRTWAAACRSTEPTLDNNSLPFLDRSIIIDSRSLRQKILDLHRQFREGQVEEVFSNKSDCLPVPVSNPSRVICATFTLGKDQIARLKDKVLAKRVEEGKPPSFHISSFVATCAYVWSCLTKAREYGKDFNQCFICAVDWRARMKPPLPRNFFGNCLGFCTTVVKVGELMRKDGFEVAAREIGRSIDGLQGMDLYESLKIGINTFVELLRNKPFTVAGSPKLRAYEVDFGWGRPVKVEITSIYESGAMSLAESREEEGGMEIGLVLPAEEMSKFETNFVNGFLDL